MALGYKNPTWSELLSSALRIWYLSTFLLIRLESWLPVGPHVAHVYFRMELDFLWNQNWKIDVIFKNINDSTNRRCFHFNTRSENFPSDSGSKSLTIWREIVGLVGVKGKILTELQTFTKICGRRIWLLCFLKNLIVVPLNLTDDYWGKGISINLVRMEFYCRVGHTWEKS